MEWSWKQRACLPLIDTNGRRSKPSSQDSRRSDMNGAEPVRDYGIFCLSSAGFQRKIGMGFGCYS
ncbi:hypothetical protein MA16_Dca027579 [Dendrobium catenatum]|uniref:Uncharacterized protein n=1 Tax=Dendrobium catenatum TaxID=906689 RepID=A0A2I0XA55_9ASPA|nr:hypothetical protein MA16_Dca027579 [Dendrobium catenatum]